MTQLKLLKLLILARVVKQVSRYTLMFKVDFIEHLKLYLESHTIQKLTSGVLVVL